MPGEERKSFLLRIPSELWRELEAWAAADLRSVNGQIEFLLRDAVGRRKKRAKSESRAGASPSGEPSSVDSSRPRAGPPGVSSNEE